MLYNLQIIHRIGTETTNNQLHMICAFGILAAIVFVERWTGHSRPDLVIKQPRLRNNFVFGMLYSQEPGMSRFFLSLKCKHLHYHGKEKTDNGHHAFDIV